MQRIVVVGTPGSGKTTVARRFALKLGIPHVELDALHWEPNWVEAPLEVFRQRVSEAVGESRWVVDGNYSMVRDLVWDRADTVVWLDYSFTLVFWRILVRTIRRLLTKEELWNGNRERLSSLIGGDSMPYWVIKTYPKQKREYPKIFSQPEYSHIKFIRHRKPKETEAWLENLTENYNPQG